MIENYCTCGKTSLFLDSLAGSEGKCPKCKHSIFLEKSSISPFSDHPKLCENCKRKNHSRSTQCLFCGVTFPKISGETSFFHKLFNRG